MKKLGLFILLFALAIVSCRKNIDEVVVTETPHVPTILDGYDQLVVPVDGSLTGFVTDEAGEPVEGANVRMGNLTTITDTYGHFFFKDVTLNARGTFVQVEKAGYFKGSRRFFAIEDAENRVTIELMAKVFEHAFDAQSGGLVEMNGGATVNFSPGSIANADGTPYTGNVRVAAKWLDPTDLNTLNRMPGNLQGVDILSQEVALRTAGMMVVELESDAGAALNILDGETAEISMPFPEAFDQLGAVPDEIAHWSFNEEYGMWVEEGVSYKQGNSYVGQVSHFSYWNHDFKDPLIEFTATFVDVNGTPLENYLVVISQPGTWLSGSGHTCDRGIVNGLIPQNYELLLEVYGICGEVLYSQDIGPYPNDVNLGTITVPNSSLNPTTIEGELVDCFGDPVQNGIATFQFDGKTIYEYTNGDPFSVLISSCDATTDISVFGIDLDALLESDPVTVSVGGIQNVGQISVCDQQVQNYIRIDVDGEERIYTPASIFPDSIGSTGISFYDQTNQSNIYLSFLGNDVGDFGGGNGNFIEVISDGNWSFSGGFFDTFNVTEFGDIGEPIIGNFSGTLNNGATQPPVSSSVSGDFHIIRQ